MSPAVQVEAAARAAGARVRAARRRAHASRSTCASSRRPIATSRQMVSDGTFREDLFYRLNVIPIEIPPLRERREDIPLLVDHFVRKHQQRTGKRIDRVDDGVRRGAAALRLAGQRARAREHDRARGGPVDRRRDRPRVDLVARRWRRRPIGLLPSLKLRTNIEWVEQETIRRALEQRRRREERRRRTDGHQPARAELLPGQVQVPIRHTRVCLTRAVTDYGALKPLCVSLPISSKNRRFRSFRFRHRLCLCDP